jgi:hypothetical protein
VEFLLLQVDNHHDDLDTVGPLLRETLADALLATWGAEPLVPAMNQAEQPVSAASGMLLQCVCFQGCVQLLASVYRPRRGPARAPGEPAGGGYSEVVVANRLLQLLHDRGAAAQQPNMEAGRIGRPLGLVLGDAAPAVAQQGGSAGAGSSRAPQRIQLLWQDIPALTAGAGNQQQPVLVLDLEDVLPNIMAGPSAAEGAESANSPSSSSSSSSSSSLVGSWARLMIFSDKQVLFDQLLQLQAAIR